MQSASGLDDALDKDYLLDSGLERSGESSAAPTGIAPAGPTSGTGRGAGKGSGQDTEWREAKSNYGSEGVDFNMTCGFSTNSVAYAFREIASASDRRAALKLGSDDGVKVWVNGELVLAHHILRACVPDDDAVVVSLKRGRNSFLVKVSQAEGDWVFTMRLVPLEEDSKAGSRAELVSLVPCPDELAVGAGGTVSGTVMTKPAFCVEGEAKVELLGPRGEVLAQGAAPMGGRFSLRPPSGILGLARIRASGKGGLSGLAPGEALVSLGDSAAIAAKEAEEARSEAGALGASDAIGAGGLDRPSLEFLAALVEGGLRAPLGSFENAAFAVSEIERARSGERGAQTGAQGGGLAILSGLGRYAYRSPLDGSLQPYSLYLPEGYDSAKRYALLVALHGAGGDDFEMASSLASARPKDTIVLAPFGRGDSSYESTGERDVLDAVDLVESRYAIDQDRVYLTGRSMGGFGTWRLAQLYPRRFAAIAPFAGWTGLDCLENLSSIPVLAVHGDADPIVPIGGDASAVQRLESLGAQVRFDVLHGAGHDALGAWTAASGTGRLFDWLRGKVKARWPAEDRVRTTMARYGRGTWAAILGLERPLELAALDAKILDERHVAVETRNVSVFELDLRHPALAKSGRVIVLADGIDIAVDARSPGARFEHGADGVFAKAAARKAAAPEAARPANDGSGLAALFQGKLRVVYGTKRRAADNEAVAREIADWIGGSGGNDVKASAAIGGAGSFEVVPDSASSPRLEAEASTLLIGWPEDNSALSRVAGKLAVQIKGGKVEIPGAQARGRGILLVCPNPEAPGRLMGVLALPVQGKEAAEYAQILARQLRGAGANSGLCGFGTPDAVIWDGSLKPVWAGFFDWRWEKLSPQEDGES
jgi:poly(3-hydroxybutyrate) depolymerase